MRKKFYGRRLFAVCLVCCLMLGLPPSGFADAAAAPKLNRKKITLSVGEKTTLKVKNAKGTVKWSSSNKKVASVSKGSVRAKKEGKAKITAKIGKKKLTCTVCDAETRDKLSVCRA